MATDLSSLRTTVKAAIAVNGGKSVDLLGELQFALSKALTLSLNFGTGSGKSNQAWFDQRVLANGTSEELDLASGLTNVFGHACVFTKIHAILIINQTVASAAATLQIGGAVANSFDGPFVDSTDKLALEAGCPFLVVSEAGWTVTAGTGDLLKIENMDGVNEATYDIVIVGEE